MSSRDRARLKRWMSSALKMRSENRRKQAIACLLRHPSELQRLAPLAGLLATLCFEIDDYPNAAKWYGRATALSPQSEMASLGLFHSLWEIGRHEDALLEMRRFLGTSDSKEYSRLLTELRKDLLGDTKDFRRQATKRVIPRLSMDDRMSANLAERAALGWRKTAKLLPVREFQDA